MYENIRFSVTQMESGLRGGGERTPPDSARTPQGLRKVRTLNALSGQHCLCKALGTKEEPCRVVVFHRPDSRQTEASRTSRKKLWEHRSMGPSVQAPPRRHFRTGVGTSAQPPLCKHVRASTFAQALPSRHLRAETFALAFSCGHSFLSYCGRRAAQVPKQAGRRES